jgi:hypothetical protein
MTGHKKICSNIECQKEFIDYSKHQHEKYCSIKCKSNDPNRFWSKVQKTEYCWLWIGRIDQEGYGRLDKNNKGILAHRLSYELHNGLIPNGLDVLHTCDNPKCVNPEHLWIGTHTDNMRDMFAKGRRKIKKGEENNNAKLTKCQVLEIKRKYKKGNGATLAKEYNVSLTTISHIIHKKIWSWLNE